MHLKSAFPNVYFRRTRRSDAPALADLMKLYDVTDGGIPTPGVFGAAAVAHFRAIIETSLLTLTAVQTIPEKKRKAAGQQSLASSMKSYDAQLTAATSSEEEEESSEAEERMVGFIALSDIPTLDVSTMSTLLQVNIWSNATLSMTPQSTVWLRMLLAPPSAAFLAADEVVRGRGGCCAALKRGNSSVNASYTAVEMASELFRLSLGSLSGVEHVLALVGASYSCLKATGGELITTPNLSPAPPYSLWHWDRSALIAPLLLRRGRIEDYDDIVALLVAGGPGIITVLPRDLYMEEVLQDQDHIHKVVVVEHTITHEVLGVACLRQVTLEEQNQMARLYEADSLQRFRPISHTLLPEVVPRKSDAGGHPEILDELDDLESHNRLSSIFQIDFLYFNPDYDGGAYQLLPYLFDQYPSCEYATLLLRHTILPEPLLLECFEYMPLRCYQPHNIRGELVPAPDGLWVCSRFAIGRVHVETANASAVLQRKITTHLLTTNDPMLDTSVEAVEILQMDLREDAPSTAAVFALVWSETKVPVGVVSVTPLSVAEVYALRANYDLDRFIDFYAKGGFDYTATDISLTAEAGPLKYRTTEMAAVVVRAAFIRTAFKSHAKFLLREVLRLCSAEVVLTLTNPEAVAVHTLLSTLTMAPPRRVVENYGPLRSSGGAVGAAVDGNPGDLTPLKPSTNDISNGSASSAAPPFTLAESEGFASLRSSALGSVFFTTRRYLGDERVRVHGRIVVVGASATTLSMLYQLLSVPYLQFSNLVLISTDGMPSHPNQVPQQWEVDTMDLLEREYMRLLFQNKNSVRVVRGAMVDIHTSLKFVQVDNGTYEPYDQLILATGRQYIIPPKLRALQQQDSRQSYNGIIALSGELAEERLRYALLEMEQSTNGMIANVVIYGSGLDAYAAISSMVSLGFPAQRLVLCRPQEKSPFADEACADAILALFRRMGISVLDGYEVSRLEYDEDSLSSVMLASSSPEGKSGDAVELPCSLIVCQEEQDIDGSVLSALTKRSIVFDGRVIVGNEYQTSDPSILAAGPVAMFTRRFGETENFDAFASRDVGRDVAHVILGKIGIVEFMCSMDTTTAFGGNGSPDSPTGATITDTLYAKVLQESGSAVALSRRRRQRSKGEQRNSASVSGGEYPTYVSTNLQDCLPVYQSPVARRLRLPCGYQYFSALQRSDFDPTKCIRLDSSTADMSTVPFEDVNNAQSGGQLPVGTREMLVVYVNEETRHIEAILYIGNGLVEVHNYLALVGLPESLLHLRYRYDEALVADASGGTDTATLPSTMTTTPCLTVPPCCGRLHMISYLRLSHLQHVFSDKFLRFFAALREMARKEEQAVAVRTILLKERELRGTLSHAEVNTYVASLTDAKKELRHHVQLVLLKFLHEQKDCRSQEMYLPSIVKAMSARPSAVAAAAKDSKGG